MTLIYRQIMLITFPEEIQVRYLLLLLPEERNTKNVCGPTRILAPEKRIRTKEKFPESCVPFVSLFFASFP
jgi:hypothetical protein